MFGSSGPLRDRHNRRIEYVRVSITEQCNYRCVFCMPREDNLPPAKRPRLATDETLRLCGVLSRLGVGKFKITGGEPFMNPDALAILAGLKNNRAVKSVTVTTNASALGRHADALADIGVDGVNISLNAITPETYARVTRSAVDVDRILDNILLAADRGLAVKLNMVPIRGINDVDIIPVLDFALDHGMPVRFIELMPLGEGMRFSGLSHEEVRGIVEKRFGPTTPAAERQGNGPAVYFTVAGHSARIGYITALTDNFCNRCNRIRLTSAGFLKTCLHHKHGGDLAASLRNGADDDALANRIRKIVADKPERHDMEHCPAGGEPMHRIGG